MPFHPHRRKWQSIDRVLATVVCCISVLQATLAGPTSPAGSPQPRSLHTGTYLGESVHFVGGLGGNESFPTQILSLQLKSLVFTLEKTDLQVYRHVAIPENKTEGGAIGVMFGEVPERIIPQKAVAYPLQWVNVDGTPSKPAPNKTAVTPGARRSHSLAQINNKYYIIGGETALGRPVLDIPVYDTISNEWTIITPKTPIQRVGHSSVAIDNDNILICFGQDKTPLPATPATTTTRAGATATRTNSATATATTTPPNSALPSTATADCLIYEVSTDTLKPAPLNLTPTISFDSGLVGHTMVRSSKQPYLFLFGGSNLAQNTTYGDMLIFDVSDFGNIVVRRSPTSQHHDPTIQATVEPSARAFHSATVVGDKGELMVIYGGSDPAHTLNDTQPYFYNMGERLWIDDKRFLKEYLEGQTKKEYTNVWIIIASIAGSVSLLGVAVFFYIRRGLAKTEEERRRKEYEKRLSTMSGGRFSPTGAGRRGAGEAGAMNNMENKRRQVYPSASSSEDQSHGAYRSTTSLIQPPPEALTKNNSHHRHHHNHHHHRADSDASTSSTISTSRSRNNSQGEHTLSAEGGYRRTPAQTPGGQASMSTAATSGVGSSNATTLNGGSGSNSGAGGSAPYYNPLDLYPDDAHSRNHTHQRRHGSDGQQDDDYDDDTSVDNSESTMSPWTGTLHLANPSDNFEFAPPNPRFSRGAMSAAHRQLVSGANGHRASVTSNNNGWENRSPGGATVSSRDDESHRRSVNSMQWVSYEPLDIMNHRPDSEIFDPLSARAVATTTTGATASAGGGGGGLTVRNVSWIQQTDTPRGSVYGSYYNTPGSVGGAPSSDGGGTTTSEDSFAPGTFGGYHSPASSQSGSITGGERRISAAVMARQQRRSQLRNSQDSFGSTPGGTPTTAADGHTPPFVTKAVPILTSRPVKQAGGSHGDGLQVSRRDGSRGGAGNMENRLSFGLPTIDGQSLSTTMGMTTSGNINLNAALQNMGSQPNGAGGGDAYPTSAPIGTTSAHGPRISSMLNPKRTSRTPSAYYGQQQPPQPPPAAYTSSSQSRAGPTTNVILKMPPPPKHPLPQDASTVREVE